MNDTFSTLFNSPKESGASGRRAKGALLVWLRVAWLCLSPLGVTFAGRIAWEKTVWTVIRGPQMVGFSLMHIHPGFFVAGVLSAGLLMFWSIPAIICAFLRREFISTTDIVMILVALFVAAAMLTPDTLFASEH